MDKYAGGKLGVKIQKRFDLYYKFVYMRKKKNLFFPVKNLILV